MDINMRLKKVPDDRLLKDLKALARREREILGELLRYLQEVETRQLHLSRGFPSLFAFCTEALGYSENEAHVRIQAMRLTRALPEAAVDLQNGRISLSVAAQVQSCFRRAEKEKRPVPQFKKLEILQEMHETTSRQAERKLAAHFPEMRMPPEKARALTAEMTRLELNLPQELLAKLERLQQLMAHKNFSGRYDLLFDAMAEIALDHLDPERKESRKTQKRERTSLGTSQVKKVKQVNSEAEETTPHPPDTKPLSRHIPSVTRRRVWLRAEGRCEYHDNMTGKRCSARHGMQIDHIQEFSCGGTHDLGNLRLYCGAHNRARGKAAEYLRRTTRERGQRDLH